MADFDLLDAATGQPVRVSADEAAAGLREGRLRAGRPLRARDPGGRTGTLAPDRIGDALARGYTLDTPEAEARREYQREHPIETQVVNPTVTAASGVLREGSLGASELGEQALGVRDEINTLREENPTAASVGDVGGLVLPAMLTGGVSAEARGASALARGVTAPGRAVLGLGEQLGARTTAALAGTESTAARRILARVAGGGVEGAVMTGGAEAGHIVTEEALGEDPGDIADRLLMSSGLGAILGGGLHGAGGVLGEGVRAGRQHARDLSELLTQQYATQTGRELPRGMGDVFADLVARGSAAVRGESPAGARRFLGRDGREALSILERGDGAVDEASAGLRGEIDRLLPRARHVGEEMIGLKPESLEARMGGDLVQQRATAQQMIERARRLQGEIEGDFAVGGRAGSAYGRGAGSAHARLRGFIDRAEARLRDVAGSDARQGAHIFAALDQLKRDVGGIRREMDRSGSTFGRDATNGLYQDLRSPLERADVWGDGAAALQRETNQGWASFIPWDNDVDRMLLREGAPIEGDFGRAQQANSANVRAFVGALGQERNATAESIFDNWLDGLESRNRAALEHHSLTPEARADAEALPGQIARVREQLAEARRIAQTLEAGRQLGQRTGALDGLAATAGFLGVAPVAAPLAAAAALSRPLTIARTLATIRRLTQQSDGAITSAVRGFLSRARGVASRSARSAPRVLRPAFTVGAYRERMAQMDRDRDRSQLASRIGESTRALSAAAPRAQAQLALRAARAAQFLETVRPRGAAGGIFPGRHEELPSRAEMDRFMRYARAVDAPADVIDDVKQGRVTHEAMQALREVYPALYARLTREIMQQVAEGEHAEPSYQDRIQLGLIMGQAIDPTMRPEFLSMLQSSSVPTAPPQQAAARSAAPDLSGQLASESDRLVSRRATG